MTDTSNADQVRDVVNAAFHRAFDVEPCESACTHFVTERWSALGIANVFARRAAQIAATEVRDD